MHQDKTTRILFLPLGQLGYPIILIFCALLFLASTCVVPKNEPSETADSPSKHRGAHIFGKLDSLSLIDFSENNYDWITLVSYGVQEDFDSPVMKYYKGDSLEVLRRDSAWQSQISIVHTAGFKVCLKPHIWLTQATQNKWRSDIYPKNDENWERWQESYREFILLYAEIAEKNEVALFCIGTELSRLTKEKPRFWKSLITEIKSIYSGEIVYAANWHNEYEKIDFWDQLDYIGVQAYFPLVDYQHASVSDISRGWKKHLSDLASVQKRYGKPVLFTEMGYKSTSDSGIKPWEWMDYSDTLKANYSEETQANCYQAFFDMVWEKEWFAGVHLWQLRTDYSMEELNRNTDFTPQDKLAEEVIRRGFGE